MEENAEILEPLELHFSDLMLLSSSSSRVSSEEEAQRLQNISRAVMETLGPSGPGLLAITGVPKAPHLRRNLLPLARKLALLNIDECRRILKDHNLGSDVPLKNLDRIVSSFASQLKYVQDPNLDLTFNWLNHKGEEEICISEGQQLDMDKLNVVEDNEYKNLGTSFSELGICMMELGLCLARVCDKAIGGQELEKSILESCTAKGRLIHYHSILDNHILKEVGRRKGSTKVLANHIQFQLHDGSKESEPAEGLNLETSGNEVTSCRTSLSNLWQQWHYDYGIFTVLTAPMFISPCHPPKAKANVEVCVSYEQECPPPDGHTYLQIFDPYRNNVRVVRSPPESFIVQVGEAADILSNGKLRSTLHSVYRPVRRENLSRETFVVFLQPAWSKTFSTKENSFLSGQGSGAYNGKTSLPEQEPHKLSKEIHKIVPPLSSRLKDGMTFAEFARETTKQYYGGGGLQSKR